MDDLQTIYSYERFSGEHSYHQCIVNPNYVKKLTNKKLLRFLRDYVDKIQEIPFDNFAPKDSNCFYEEEECQDCGGTVGETCAKCRPSHFCHYCGGYDHNFLRNEKFPCIVWCTPSSRLIHPCRPLAVQNPYFCLQTTSFSEGIYKDGHC